MALYPGARHRIIPKWNTRRMVRYRRMNLHVAVMNGASAYGWFSSTNSACSHFYVAKDGTVEQYIDTRYQGAADLHGNDSTISVETAGGVTNVNGEKWTDAQVISLAKLWAWARDTHGIRNQVAKNTNTNANSSGLSWHRLGIIGNFGGRPGICAVHYGKILYSHARGKECPGDAKILQIPGIWSTANGKSYKQIGSTSASKPAASKPANKPSRAKPAKKVAKQSAKNPPNGSTTFPKDYASLSVNGKLDRLTIGAHQILMHAIGRRRNRRWDGKFERLTIMDTQEWLRGLGYYKATPFAAKGVRKGTALKADGQAGYWFWVEFMRFLAKKGLYKRAVDGDPGSYFYKAWATYLNKQH